MLVLLSLVLILPTVALPTLEVSIINKKDRVPVNKTFTLDLHIYWHGDADDFIVEPPSLRLPDDITQKGMSFSTSVTGDQYNLDFHYTLSTQNKGKFLIEPVQIKYWGKGDEKERIVLTEKVEFEAITFTILGLNMIWTLTIGVVLLILAIITGVLLKDKKMLTTREGTIQNIADSKENVLKKLRMLKESKINGDTISFYRCAIEILRATAGDQNSLNDLGKVLEQVQFGGYKPTSEELDKVFRHLVKEVENSFPNQESKELASIKYA
jgi:hypothetical protein